MTKLEELIKELCPNGVDNVELGEVLNYEQPQKYIVKDTNYDKSYRTPVLTAGQTFILGYTNEIEGIYCASKDNPVIIFDDFTTSFHWVDFDFKIKSSAMKMLRVKDTKKCLFKYIFYAMQTIKYVPYGHTRQWIENYSRLQIPLPPLAVQREIVQILDKFTLLSAELTAELTARRKQYEFYRDKLLTFDVEIKFKELWEVCRQITDGSHNPPNGIEFSSKTFPMISAQNISNGKIDYNNVRWLNENDFEIENKRSKAEVGDVLMTIVGAIGRVAVIKENPKMTFQRSVCILKPKHNVINSDFLRYILESNQLQNEIQKQANGAAQRGIYLKQVSKLKFPVPPLDMQERIVKVLDNFDAICSDLEIGLPAEIEARQKQYEFYRDKLLKF